jgi:simple sugar transport system ATP-binding protein
LRVASVTKRFGATVAVEDVSLEFATSEIAALVGENGAGKTTLMSITAGELRPDAGSVETEGEVGMVHQHFMLVSDFTIAENLALTMGRLLGAREAEEVVAATGIELRGVTRRVRELSVGEKSKLELIKAIARRPRVLILDEPTSVLTPSEARELFGVMRRLAAEGTAVVFISHKIPEVLEVAKRVVVMRRGRVVAEGAMSAAEMAAAMIDVGRASARQAGLRPGPPGHGEILAVIGVAGNGQAELAARARAEARGRVAQIPEDRTRDGIIAEMSIAENLALRAPRWQPREAHQRAAALIEQFNIRAQSPRQRAGALSGGNQQKVVLARELGRNPDVIIASEPTRGLDIEATRYVHEQLRAAAARGAKILLITSDLDEAFALADAVQVIYRGRLSERMTPEEAGIRAPQLMAGLA